MALSYPGLRPCTEKFKIKKYKKFSPRVLDFSFHFDKELLPYQASMTFGDMAIIYAVESGMGRFYFEIQFLVSGPDEGE